MEGRRLDAVPHGPLHGSLEDRLVVGVHAEHEAAVDHHAEAVEALDGGGVVPSQVLQLALREKGGAESHASCSPKKIFR